MGSMEMGIKSLKRKNTITTSSSGALDNRANSNITEINLDNTTNSPKAISSKINHIMGSSILVTNNICILLLLITTSLIDMIVVENSTTEITIKNTLLKASMRIRAREVKCKRISRERIIKKITTKNTKTIIG